MFKNFCHDQVKLLLERMDSNPEEFLHHSKWNPFLPNMHHVAKGTTDYFPAFNVLERTLIARKFNKLCQTTMRQHAYNRILEVAIAGKGQWINPTTTMSSVSLNSGTNIANAITIGNETLTADDLRRLKNPRSLIERLFA